MNRKNSSWAKCLLLLFLSTAFFLTQASYAQYAVATFSKFEKVKGADDKPIGFTTSFPVKSQVYVQLTYPAEPEFYTINCYMVNDAGQEKLTGTTDIKCFEKKSTKTIKNVQSLGMMYDAGNYKVQAVKQSDKKVIAESNFTVIAGETKTAATADVIFCEDTDDNFNPIKPVQSIKSGDSVNFLAKLKDGIGAKFFIWAVFEIKADGDEVLFKDMQENVDNEKNRWFATVQKTYFTKAGKYAVYMLQQNATNSGMTVNKPTKYYARGVLTVK